MTAPPAPCASIGRERRPRPHPPASRALRLLGLLSLLWLMPPHAGAGPIDPALEPPGSSHAGISARERAQLKAQIAQDRETLKQMISGDAKLGADLNQDPRLREISERLPRLQAELRERRAESSP